MRIAAVKQIVLTELTAFAEEHGLKVKKSDFGVSSKRGQNPSYSIYFIHNTWVDEVDLFPKVCIKFKEIHDICERCGFHLNYTLYFNLLLLEEVHKQGGWSSRMQWEMERYRRERIILLDDVEWIDKFRETMNRLCPLAIDYINRYSTIEALDKLYNQFPIDEYNPNCCSSIHHCFIGLIAAKLANNPEYKLIKDVYSAIIKIKGRQETKIAFARLIKYLDDMPVQKTD